MAECLTSYANSNAHHCVALPLLGDVTVLSQDSSFKMDLVFLCTHYCRNEEPKLVFQESWSVYRTVVVSMP